MNMIKIIEGKITQDKLCGECSSHATIEDRLESIEKELKFLRQQLSMQQPPCYYSKSSVPYTWVNGTIRSIL